MRLALALGHLFVSPSLLMSVDSFFLVFPPRRVDLPTHIFEAGAAKRRAASRAGRRYNCTRAPRSLLHPRPTSAPSRSKRSIIGALEERLGIQCFGSFRFWPRLHIAGLAVAPGRRRAMLHDLRTVAATRRPSVEARCVLLARDSASFGSFIFSCGVRGSARRAWVCRAGVAYGPLTLPPLGQTETNWSEGAAPSCAPSGRRRFGA